MAAAAKLSWDDRKRQINIEKHGYDFAAQAEVFDGRFVVTREDTRNDYGERRYNTLTEYAGRVVNVTFSPRGRMFHLISARPASRIERKVYFEHRQIAGREAGSD